MLDIFDEHIRANSYNNRSEAIRDLIRKAFVKEEWEADKQVMGVISLVYDHHQHKLQEKVTIVQHDYHHQIVSTTHVHMDHDNCLEVIVVRGKRTNGEKIMELLKTEAKEVGADAVIKIDFSRRYYRRHCRGVAVSFE